MMPKPISLESEAGFRVLFECATVGILVISEGGYIELSNACSARLFGYETAELIGKPIEILLPETFRHKHIRHREKYFERPKARPMGVGMEWYAPTTVHIPFIFVTASVEKSEIATAMKMGADGYICKPFDIEDLTVAINNVVI